MRLRPSAAAARDLFPFARRSASAIICFSTSAMARTSTRRSLSGTGAAAVVTSRDGRGTDAELPGRDQLTLGEDERPLDGVLQLADVAGPRVRREQIARLVAEAGVWLAHLTAQLTHEVISEEQDIVAPFAQGRQMDAKHRKSVVKILAEPAIGHGTFKVAIGGRNETDVGLQRRRAADTLVPPLLQHAQELRLRRRGKLADLVEKQRATRCGLEAATLQLVSTGKGTTFVTEQLGLDERFRQRRAVERDEWPVRPRARLMDRPRQDLLAGPALAGEQHGRAGGRHLSRVVDSCDELRCPTADRIEREPVIERGPQRRHLSLELLRFRLDDAQPLLVLGQPLVLDRKHERRGDRGADLDIALVVPVLTRRDEEEPTAGLLTEQQRHAEY